MLIGVAVSGVVTEVGLSRFRFEFLKNGEILRNPKFRQRLLQIEIDSQENKLAFSGSSPTTDC